MYKMHMYRDGTLPPVRPHVRDAHLDILHCSFWVLRAWNHSNLASPYWRLYWNPEIGAEVHLGERSYPLDPDHLLLIGPNTPFTTRFQAGGRKGTLENVMVGCPAAEWDGGRQGSDRVVRHFFTHFTAGLPYDAIAPQIFAIPIEATLRALLEKIVVQLASDDQVLNHQQSFCLQALLSYALGAVPEACWPTPQTDERVLTVLHFIDEHYHQPLTNNDFASLATMSPKGIVRLFKDKMRQTPLAYLLQRRLERASILLHHTDESIERIADLCGFYDRHHMTNLFKRKFHIGPATYRKSRML
ncbi:MAG TPA: AraC family transcriptional regulator [Armatimonadota bacterium]|jgi:AraC-like DNA-binding protein